MVPLLPIGHYDVTAEVPGFNETIASWLEQQGVPASQARAYIARLFLGVTTGAVEAPKRSFQSLAATHATAGGINEQFLKHLVEHGLLTRVSEALDAVLQPNRGRIIDCDFGTTV